MRAHTHTDTRTQEPREPQDYLQPILNQDSSSASRCPVPGRSAQTAHPTSASRPTLPPAPELTATPQLQTHWIVLRCQDPLWPPRPEWSHKGMLCPHHLLPLAVGAPHPQGAQELASSCPGSKAGARLGKRGSFSGKPQRVEAGLLGLSPNSDTSFGNPPVSITGRLGGFCRTAHHAHLPGAGPCIAMTATMRRTQTRNRYLICLLRAPHVAWNPHSLGFQGPENPALPLWLAQREPLAAGRPRAPAPAPRKPATRVGASTQGTPEGPHPEEPPHFFFN